MSTELQSYTLSLVRNFLLPREFPFFFNLAIVVTGCKQKPNGIFISAILFQSSYLYSPDPTQNPLAPTFPQYRLIPFHSAWSLNRPLSSSPISPLKRSFYFFSIKFYGFIIHKRNTNAKRSSSTVHLLLSFRFAGLTMKNRYVIFLSKESWRHGRKEEPSCNLIDIKAHTHKKKVD